MEMMLLEECCEILDAMRVPIAAKNRKKGPYPYYGANGIQDYVEDYIFDDDLVLLAEDGGNFGSDERPIAYKVSGKCWVNNHAHVLKPKTGIDVDYLCYSLMFYKVDGMVNGATRMKLTQAAMRKMLIPSRTITEQKDIVRILNKVQMLIKAEKEQIKRYDDLVKSRFFELFGDPVINSKGLPTTDFINVVKLQRGYDLPTQDRDSAGTVPVYGSSGVLDYHTESMAEHGIITGRSGTIGKVAYCKGRYWPLNTTLFSVETKGNNIIYLAYLLDYYDLSRFYDGTGVPTLNRNVVHKKQIITIPREEQDAFADFVEETDKLKVLMKASLEKLETINKALMQQYFK